MIRNTLFNKGSIPILEQMVYFTTQRHKASAANIANAETPQYKAVDVPEADFQAALEEAIAERDRRPVPVFEFTGDGGIRPKAGGGLEIELIEKIGGFLKHDENNVDIDLEMAGMLKNAKRHNLATTILGQQFTLLRSAISERILG